MKGTPAGADLAVQCSTSLEMRLLSELGEATGFPYFTLRSDPRFQELLRRMNFPP